MCILRTFLIAIAPLSPCTPPGIPLYNLCPCLCPPSSRNYSSARTTTLPRTFSNHHIIIALLLLLPTATTEDRQRRHLLTLLHYWWAPVPSVHPRGIGQNHHHTPPPQWLWLTPWKGLSILWRSYTDRHPMIWYSDCNGSSASYECRRPWLCVYITVGGETKRKKKNSCVWCAASSKVVGHDVDFIHNINWNKCVLWFVSLLLLLLLTFVIILILRYLDADSVWFAAIRVLNTIMFEWVKKNNTTLIDHCDWFNIQLHLTTRECVCVWISIDIKHTTIETMMLITTTNSSKCNRSNNNNNFTFIIVH